MRQIENTAQNLEITGLNLETGGYTSKSGDCLNFPGELTALDVASEVMSSLYCVLDHKTKDGQNFFLIFAIMYGFSFKLTLSFLY